MSYKMMRENQIENNFFIFMGLQKVYLKIANLLDYFSSYEYYKLRRKNCSFVKAR